MSLRSSRGARGPGLNEVEPTLAQGFRRTGRPGRPRPRVAAIRPLDRAERRFRRPRDPVRHRSALAAGTEPGRPLLLDDPADGAAATPAGEPVPAIHPAGELEVATDTVGALEVAQGGAAHLDRLAQGGANRLGQAFVAREPDRPRGAGRAYPGPMQALGGVDVAHPDDRLAGEQELLDRGDAPPGRPVEMATVEFLREGLDAQPGEQRVILDGAQRPRVPEHRAETPRIVEPGDAMVEHDVEMIVSPRRRRLAPEHQVAAHAEMHDQRARSEPEQQVFAAAAHRGDLQAREDAVEIGRDWPAQRRRPYHDGTHRASEDRAFEAAPDRLDFGQFGHPAHLAPAFAWT